MSTVHSIGLVGGAFVLMALLLIPNAEDRERVRMWMKIEDDLEREYLLDQTKQLLEQAKK